MSANNTWFADFPNLLSPLDFTLFSMFEKLPSLLGFQPRFYTGGPTRFHLPLFYDLIAVTKPKTVVTLGFGDGQAFFTFCQAVREQNIECRCVAVRREHADEKGEEDSAWLAGKNYGNEFYGDMVCFESGSDALNKFADQSIELLLLEDCDSGSEIRRDLSRWEPKISPNGLVLFHGVDLERIDDVKAAWLGWVGSRPTMEFPAGIGLGVAVRSESSQLREPLFSRNSGATALDELYRLAAVRIEAQASAAEAVRQQRSLQARQVWIDSLLADRWKVQEVMDYQASKLAELSELQRRFDGLQSRFDALLADRAKAQLIMDSQHDHMDSQREQLDQWITEAEKLKAQLKETKRILSAAKQACSKKGKCFRPPESPKERRPLKERILRELQRIPRNLRISPASKNIPQPGPAIIVATDAPIDRYAEWIRENEPDAVALEKQRNASSQLQTRPKISLLVPVHNTPARFLEEMFTSISHQTYDQWELCVVDGGSDESETLALLQQWASREARIHLRRLEKNLGISENTNRALELATGDFIACIDHDDLLAPFALYELARAINDFPEGDIFYSDEDRWSGKGKRKAPFFKPEWSPEFLYTTMYVGHLTAYRRTLVDEIGGFRKEFDLSQDYDFALRATEQAKAICHIPRVLYHWREHPASGSAGGKPEARKTNLAALDDAMRRRGLSAEIIEYPAANRVRFKILDWPKVSIIIPTDSAECSRLCVEQLPRQTSYPNYEIVVVTNSKLAGLLEVAAAKNPTFRFIRYDKPFNFSDKCNVGAQAATGTRLIFFNDDVESGQSDWIQNLIEPLENTEVGAVAPKLLYATGKIQHAGLVTGVRGLVGTACHEWPADSLDHTNLAQSMRDVSALSAACLAMRRDDFFRVGAFDAANTPIDHSDIDLCFKIREAELRCVYTPFVTMTHRGHVSIRAAEIVKPRTRDKAEIYLLKRWAGYTCHDPYFPDNMRDWLYGDSPTPIRMFGADNPDPPRGSRDLLFVSHDLSLSGAPILLLHLAIWCKRSGIFVVAMAPEDGPLREKYEAAGVPLIIDPLITMRHESFVKFVRDFDCVLANTIRSESAVRSAYKANVPVIWWMHETLVGEHYLQTESKLRSALTLADVILVPTEATARVYRPYTTAPVTRLSYGIPDVAGQSEQSQANVRDSLRFLVLGSIEPRKGQDVFVSAISCLSPNLQAKAQFQLFGRVMDSEFGDRVRAAASGIRNFSIESEQDHRRALETLHGIDVLVCSSRDEAMPVTILEALSLGKAIISTTVGGVPEVLTDGHDALLVSPEDPEGLAEAMGRLIRDSELVRVLGRNGRETFQNRFMLDQFGTGFRDLVEKTVATRGGITKVAGAN